MSMSLPHRFSFSSSLVQCLLLSLTTHLVVYVDFASAWHLSQHQVGSWSNRIHRHQRCSNGYPFDSCTATTTATAAPRRSNALALSSSPSPTSIASASTSASSETNEVRKQVDPKECVKLFGRLAEKYILLDESGGKCCYSACSDCEYRLPGGGYRMADQSSARPKWIPTYASRETNANHHISTWSQQLFDTTTAKQELSREEFYSRIRALPYTQPLGGPSVSAAVASDMEDATLDRLWDLLVNRKSKNNDDSNNKTNSKNNKKPNDRLTLRRMSKNLARMAEQQQGVTWKQFLTAMQEQL